MNIKLSDHAIEKLKGHSSICPGTLRYWLSKGKYALVAKIRTYQIEQGVLVWDELRNRPLLVIMVENGAGFLVVTVYSPIRSKIWGGKEVITALNIRRARVACGARLAKRY